MNGKVSAFKRNPPLTAGLAVGLFMLLTTAFFTFQRYLIFESEQKRLTEKEAQNIKDRIIDVTNQSYAATKTLSLFITQYNGEDNFDSIASQIKNTYRYVDAVELVKGGVITKIFPLKGNEAAIGYNIIDDPLRNREAFEAIERNDLFFAGPIQLKQGYSAVVGRLPIFINQKFWGFSVVLIRLSTFFDVAGLDSSSKDFSYQFSKVDPNTGNEIYYLQDSVFLNKKGTIIQSEIEAGNWMIYVKRKNKLTIKWMAPIVIMGLLLTLISSSFVYYIVKQPYLLRRLVDQKIYEVRESEQKFRALVENAQTGVFIEQDKKIVYINPGFVKIFGYSFRQVVDHLGFTDLLKSTQLENGLQQPELMHTGMPQIIKTVTLTNESIYIEVILSEIMYNHKPAVMGTVLNITARVEEDVRINKAVIKVQENERQQIGMELHDNVLQIIAASLLNVDYLELKYKDHEGISNSVTEIKKYLVETIDELRRLSHQLTPAIFTKESLDDKVESLLQTFRSTGFAEVSLKIHPFDPPLSNDVQLGLYRIIQEQLNNIYKHAKATAISIEIIKEENNLVLKIVDNGVGFDVNSPKTGIGLENIKRRAAVLGGEVNILSAPSKGCRVSVKIPIV